MLQCLDHGHKGRRNTCFIHSYAPTIELSFSLGKSNLLLGSLKHWELNGYCVFYCHGASKGLILKLGSPLYRMLEQNN